MVESGLFPQKTQEQNRQDEKKVSSRLLHGQKRMKNSSLEHFVNSVFNRIDFGSLPMNFRSGEHSADVTSSSSFGKESESVKPLRRLA